MRFSNHALQRLYERAPKLFKKYGFSLQPEQAKNNLPAGYRLARHASKIDIPPDAIGMVLNKMERHKKDSIPDLFMLEKMVFVVHNNCVTTVYPCDHWSMGFIQKFEEKTIIKNYQDFVEFACKNPSKVNVRFVTSHDQYDNIVEISDDKGTMHVFVKQSKTEKAQFQLFNDNEYSYLTRVKNVDKCMQSIRKGSFIKNSEVVHTTADATYYFVDMFEQHFYAVRTSSGHMAFLSYENKPQSVETLCYDFAGVDAKMADIFIGIKENNSVSPAFNGDVFETMMEFADFSDTLNNQTLSAVGHCFNNYVPSYDKKIKNEVITFKESLNDVERVMFMDALEQKKIRIKHGVGYVSNDIMKKAFKLQDPQGPCSIENFQILPDHMFAWVKVFLTKSEKFLLKGTVYLHEDEKNIYYGFHAHGYYGCYALNRHTQTFFITENEYVKQKLITLRHEEMSVQNGEKGWNIVTKYKKLIVKCGDTYFYLSNDRSNLSYIPLEEMPAILTHIAYKR